ncbi:MAG: class I SAM-dependent methyltransferase [Opitutales bacterium]
MRPRAVFFESPDLHAQADGLAERHGLPVVDASGVAQARQRARLRFYRSRVDAEAFLAFRLRDCGLELVLVEADRMVAIQADFTSPSTRYRRMRGGGRSEAIARAVGVCAAAPLDVLDATAGLGADAFVLASLGCRMTLLERVPALRDLLFDGLARARHESASADSGLAEVISRMHLAGGDALGYLRALAPEQRPQVIYLDPMFPERKKSANVKKEMQVFHRLVGPDADAPEVLAVALEQARQRVVVKRPRLAEPLGGRPPDHTLPGVRNRFDLYKTKV